ncbi:MAG: DUF1275 family protein [Methylobacterium sp.]|uniref:DUF1275 family protein n=1 Tax=Methylobacterium sp. TaxID=409 RepID=UPI0025D75A04|nr:DUF1275 family protein [Methylobacterium sp.]MBX9930067.1 DUF1275 family protein [Methylobacterium sp.]
MSRSWSLIVGLVLTAIAGYADAIGFSRLGGLYTSFTSGNTTQFVVHLGHGEVHAAILQALPVIAFLVGGMRSSP